MRSNDASTSNASHEAGAPGAIRLAVAGVFALLVVTAIGLTLWRGPAILLDLAGYAQSLWCF